MSLQPLQIPGGLELLIILLLFLVGLVVFLASLAAAYWVYTDAKNRGSENAAIWGVLTLLGFFTGFVPGVIVVVVAYLVAGRE